MLIALGQRLKKLGHERMDNTFQIRTIPMIIALLYWAEVDAADGKVGGHPTITAVKDMVAISSWTKMKKLQA